MAYQIMILIVRTPDRAGRRPDSPLAL